MILEFKNTLIKYERDYEVERDSGELIDGRWQDTKENFTTPLILIPANKEEINDSENGGYTTQWKKVMIRNNNPDQIGKNDIITDSEGKKYEVRERVNWADYADFKSFLAKKVVVEEE
ncbi:MAG: hypothetical protein ACLFPS_07835 [Clostridia bacterium]